MSYNVVLTYLNSVKYIFPHLQNLLMTPFMKIPCISGPTNSGVTRLRFYLFVGSFSVRIPQHSIPAIKCKIYHFIYDF